MNDEQLQSITDAIVETRARYFAAVHTAINTPTIQSRLIAIMNAPENAGVVDCNYVIDSETHEMIGAEIQRRLGAK